jgi:hypothetical protein
MTFKPKRLTGYTTDKLLEEIRRVVRDECNGTVPDSRQFSKKARVHISTIKSRFGSYEAAVKQAGFIYTGPRSKPRSRYTPDLVKADLREVLSRAGGGYFTRAFYRHHGGSYSYETVLSLLGVNRWEDALDAIGAKKTPPVIHIRTDSSQRREKLSKLTEYDLFKEIDRIWQELGRRPTYVEFRKSSQYGISAYERRYGSWRLAVEAYCKTKGQRIQGKSGTWVTKEILLAELRAVQRKRPGDLLTYDFYKKNGGTYSTGAFSKYFGSWTNAVKEVGSTPGSTARYSKEELFDEMQRLWEKYGRQPLYDEMKREGRMSPSSYENWFGSWIKAVHAFCEDRNTTIEFQTAVDQEQSLIGAVQTQNAESEGSPNNAGISSESNVFNYAVVINHKTSRTIPTRLRFRVMQRDNFTCRACGRSPAKNFGVELHVDHIYAYSKGGETIFENLQTLCKDCNLGKSNL